MNRTELQVRPTIVADLMVKYAGKRFTTKRSNQIRWKKGKRKREKLASQSPDPFRPFTHPIQIGKLDTLGAVKRTFLYDEGQVDEAKRANGESGWKWKNENGKLARNDH